MDWVESNQQKCLTDDEYFQKSNRNSFDFGEYFQDIKLSMA